jgi:cytochrome c biogenesis protein
MAVSTAGIEVRSGSRPLRDAVELVSSMRFSISLLTLICIASVIGTVVKQAEPFNNYVNQFGPFWAEVFAAANLYTVYSAWWFLLILAFLVVSTSLCIARNVPKIAVDLRTFKEHVREQSLQAFHHKAQADVHEPREATLARITALLSSGGWKARLQQREGGTMIAARKGTSNKLGYLAAHSAIVLICLGGLFDGDLIVRAQMALRDKTIYTGGSNLIREIGAQHRLPSSNPTFRANILVPEGGTGNTAVIQLPSGVILQELPFDIQLKKFIVDYYATGMPKLFASEIIIRDHETGATREALVKVNEPAFHRGVAIYQSSFDDGGSTVKLRAQPLAGGTPFDLEGRVGGSTELTGGSSGKEKITLEFTGLRVINVENFGGANRRDTDVRKVDLVGSLQDHLGSGAKNRGNNDLRNVGPSVSYKLRDASGQAREFNNYMLPVELDGQRVFLAGVRDTPAENFRYLRIPADDNDSMDSWLRLRQALSDSKMREEAARRYVALAAPDDGADMTAQLMATARQGLAIFAGAMPASQEGKPAAGLQGLVNFLEAKVPEDQRERISEVLLRIVNGSLFELLNLAREQAGQKRLEPSDTTHAFMTQTVMSLSDSYFYPAPLLLQLTDFQQVQASVFQVARAPGKTLVYLGAVLLIVGVFAMLYIRERRLWIWLQPAGERTHVTMALSATRRTLDADAEFDRMKRAVLKESA